MDTHTYTHTTERMDRNHGQVSIQQGTPETPATSRPFITTSEELSLTNIFVLNFQPPELCSPRNNTGEETRLGPGPKSGHLPKILHAQRVSQKNTATEDWVPTGAVPTPARFKLLLWPKYAEGLITFHMTHNRSCLQAPGRGKQIPPDKQTL